MTEKRFENRLNKDIKKFNALNPVWDNALKDALNVFEMIDEMNELAEENEILTDAFEQHLKRKDNRIKELKEENKELKADNEYLEKRFKEEEWHYNHIDEDRDVWRYKCNQFEKENKELKAENEQLKQQLNYIQNSISEHIKHQKTELGQKALKEIIEDYNEWLLGYNELVE